MGGPPPFFDLAFLVTAKAGKSNDPDSVLVALRSALSECGFEVEWMSWPYSEGGDSLMQVFLPFEILGDLAEKQGTRRPLKGGPNDGLYKAFRKDEVEQFTGNGSPDNMFPASIRQKLVRYALDENVKRKLAEKLNIPFRGSDGKVPSATTPKAGLLLFEDVGLVATLKTEGLVRDMLYVHQEGFRKSLMNKWCSTYLWEQPLDEVREYYGARIALYFAFLGYYTKCLAVPAISGVALYLYRKYTGTIDNLPTILYSLLLTIWSTVFLALWKRYRSKLVFRWGLMEDEIELQPRQKELEYALSWSLRNNLQTLGVIVVSVVLGSVFLWIFEETTPCMYTKYSICLDGTEINYMTYGILNPLIGYVHLIVYIVCGGQLIKLAKAVALRINEQQHHVPGTTQREDRLLMKVFGMYFIVYYISLAYYAFYLRDIERLRGWLQSLLVVKQIQGFAKEMLIPWLMHKKDEKKLAKETADSQIKGHLQNDGTGVPLWTVRQMLAAPIYVDETGENAGLFDDYLEICFQYGYVVLFSAAYPLAALFAFVNNLVEIRADAFKVCKLVQRPPAQKANDVGVWFDIFQIMSYVSVVTNCIIIAFTSDQLDNEPWNFSSTMKLMVVFGLEHMLFGLKTVIERLLPETHLQVFHGRAKQEHFDTEVKKQATYAKGRLHRAATYDGILTSKLVDEIRVEQNAKAGGWFTDWDGSSLLRGLGLLSSTPVKEE